MGRILVIDDDPAVLSALEALLGGQGHQVATAARGELGLARIERERPDLVIMDIRMPGIDGLETFRRIRRVHPRMPVIMMTGYATADAAIEATKLGAFDYHLKPTDPEALMRSVGGALECVRLMAGQVRLDREEPVPAEDAIIGQSRPMQSVYMSIGRVARSEATVLIRGETGTGKELVARAIYQHSRRAEAPLIVVNCAAIPETLLESELFGHERGAFTGAEYRRIGKFEQASGGTLLLDEIGDMTAATQSKLLRAVQDKTIERLGGREMIHTDARIIAATNRDLEAAVAEGKFREDLLYRLNAFTIALPPLRERGEDIDRLARYFIARLARQLDLEPPEPTAEALALMRRRRWPGNVRQLRHFIHRLLILTGGYPIRAEDVARVLREETQTAAPAPAPSADSQSELDRLIHEFIDRYEGSALHGDLVDWVDKRLIMAALERAGGNQTRAARLLGLTRPTLKARMDRHGLARQVVDRDQ